MKIYDCIEDICNMIKLYCFSMVLTFIVFIYYKLPFDRKIAYIFFAFVLISYLINALIHRLPLFILLHILLYVPLFMIDLTIWGKVASTILLLILTALDFSFWFFKHEQKVCTIPMPCLLVFVGIYLYSDHMERSGFTNAAYYLGQFYVIASLADMYLNNMHYLPTEGNDSLQTPKKTVLVRNNTYIIGILSTILAFNCIIHLSILEKALTFLLTKVGHFFQIILRFILQGDNTTFETEQAPSDPGYEFLAPGRPSLIAQILSYIFMAAAIGFILFVSFKAITYLVKLIIEHLNRNFRKDIPLDEDMVEVSENLRAQKRQHHKSIFKFNMDLRDRIRKRYQQEINHQIKHGYQNKDSNTPNERSTELLTSSQVDIKDLTACYNKVRYSEHSITPKEWNHIK